MDKKANIFMFHRNCPDGTGSALVHLYFQNDKDEILNFDLNEINTYNLSGIDFYKYKNQFFIPINYYDDENFFIDLISNLKLLGYNSANIFSSDITPFNLLNLLKENKIDKRFIDNIVIIDHHDTAYNFLIENKFVDTIEFEEEIKTKINSLDTTLYFSFNKSGALLTYEFYTKVLRLPNKNKKLETIIKYISDRDLWKFELSHSKEINNVIFIKFSIGDFLTRLFDFLNQLEEIDNSDEFLYKLSEMGEIIEDVKSLEYKKLKNQLHTVILETENGEKIYVPGVNNQTFYSDIANLFLNDKDVGIDVIVIYSVFVDNKTGKPKCRLSFRSKNGKAKEYAEKLGGGGHPNAAGAMIDVKNVEFSKLDVYNIEK